MKILQLIQKKQFRGAEIFASQLSLHLRSRGHEVRMVALENGDATLPISDVEVFGASPGNFWDWKIWRAIADLVHDWNPDIVQANAGDTLKYAVISKLLFRWKTPIVFRNASTMSRYIKGGIKKLFYGYILTKVSGVACVSKTSMTDITTLYPGLTAPCRVLPVGIEPTILDAHEAYGEAEDYLLHVGGFTFEKNHTGLLRICRHIWEVRPDIKLLLAGDGPLLEEIKQEVVSNGDEDRVLFLGNVDNVGALMKKARVLLLPSVIEGLPAVVLEASYCRLPVVAYDTGGIHELICHGATGWLTQIGDEKGFATEVLNILDNPVRAESVKIQAQALVNTHFLNAQVAERFLDFYEYVINGVRSSVATKTSWRLMDV